MRADQTPVARQLERSRAVGFGRDAGLGQVLDTLRWRWRWIVLFPLFFTLGPVLLVETLPSQYDGTAVVALGPRPNVPSAGADIVRVVAPKYAEYVTADETIEDVSRVLGESPSTLGGGVEAAIKPDTGILTIRVRLPSAERAADAANALARRAVDFSRRDDLLEAQIVAQALPQGSPSAPPRRLLEIAALLAGLLLGVGATVLLEKGRPHVRSWREVADLSSYPVVGRVRTSRTLRTKPTLAFSEPATGSAFRILRANLEPVLREDDVDIIVVTSPGSGDGKTTIAALLAESLARLGMHALLIDADLHRPRLARMAKVDAQHTLSHVLRKTSRLEDAVQPGWVDGLSLLPATRDPDGSDLLARNFSDFVLEARARFDIVVIDSPPLLGTDDARTLATSAKGILLVVSAGTREDSVTEAILTLEALRAPVLGLVTNRLKDSRSGYDYA